MRKRTIGDVPRCPNHGEPLQLDRTQLTQTHGMSPCPISGWMFEWVQVPNEFVDVVDKYGNITKEKVFNVNGNDDTKL